MQAFVLTNVLIVIILEKNKKGAKVGDQKVAK